MFRFIGSLTLGAFVVAPVLATSAVAQGLPPADAKPGQCYAKVLVPAAYKTVSEKVMTYSGGVKYTKTPAVYRTVEKKVLIADESYELVAVPPTYTTTQETILVQPAQTVKTVVPATYRTETKRVMISPASAVWKAGRGAYEKVDSATGEIMCRVEIPAKYNTISMEVVDRPAQTIEKVIPAKYVTITRRVVKTEATTTRKVIPAQYKTITVRELVTPESFDAVKIPARFSTIEKREKIRSESIQWRQILCETNVTKEVVLSLQKALVRSGYDLGTQPNGNYGPATKAAIRKYQLDKGLPTGGLTLSTAKSLGVI